MKISSMTGFAREAGSLKTENTEYSWFFEVKSVNGKSLDIKTKLPVWLESLSVVLKNTAAKYFARGSVSVYLEINSSESGETVRINDALLDRLAEKAADVFEGNPSKFEKPSISELMGIKGVVETIEKDIDDDVMRRLENKLTESFEKVCGKLQKDRQEEGIKIAGALRDILAKIETDVGKIEVLADKQPDRLKRRLKEQIKELLGDNPQISEERLAQEVVLYVARADIREEIDRLKAHIKTAEKLLSANEAVGRRLDFLCQELNREANTACSKSADIKITNLGMELKTLIEQLREQVQNME